nr:T9SS type A sorting domain-containing protein [Bacteroidota bacterium]
MKRLLLLILIISPFIIFSQKEANIWYFGEYTGLDFTSGSPVALTNSAMNKDEGCASISDSAGNLLFYTSGISVWNKNHMLMSNGIGLAGHNSSTQSALIVPKPGSSNIYYIFTTDAFFYANGLKYSVVDLSLNSGLGAVTQKNIGIITPATEKLTAVKHSNGIDYWMIAHYNNNSFAAYPITSSGIGTPVVTPIGVQHLGGGATGTLNAIGYMKTSPSGAKIACTIMNLGILEVFDFNTTTGVVSNPITFNNPTYYNAYGVEFSPNEEVLYFTADTALYQVNLNAGSTSAIINSVQQEGASTLLMSYLGALQLGPDNRIYCVDYFHDYVSVINQPNALGTECMWVHDGVSLNNKHCYAGLPNFVTSIFYNAPQNVRDLNSSELSLECYPNPANDKLYLKTTSKNSKSEITVYDLKGRLKFKKELKSNYLEINVSEWRKGLYFINF